MESKNYFILTKELILKQNKRDGGTETFVYEPSNIEEEPLGNLYIIGWISQHKKELAFIPNLAASLMRREFYKPSGDDPVETRFESGLKKTNAALLDIEAANPDLAGDIGLGIINTARGKIRLAHIGGLAALLYRGKEMIDISQNNQSKKKKEFFSSIITGDILQGDRLIFSTEKIIDLFSDTGLKKLGALDIKNRADIISELYQKNCQEMSLPDQAAILLEIKNRKETQTFSFKKSGLIGPPVKKYASYLSSLSKFRLNKKGKIISLFLFLLIVFLSIYLPVQSRFSIIKTISEQIKEADKMSLTDKKSSLVLLENAQNSALQMISTWYVAETARKLSAEIDKKINALNGIYKETPVELAKLQIEGVKFHPQYVFDGENAIYVFGSSADMVYKIKKDDTPHPSFAPLRVENAFAIERAFEKDGAIYLINDTGKSAYVFYPETEETEPVIKSLKKILAAPSNTAYYLDGPNKIIKETGVEKSREEFLLDSSVPIIDFAISKDGKSIYLLTKDKILSIENK